MFHKRHMIFRFLGTLLFIALLIAGGAAIFHAGQTQGYLQGVAASGVQLSAPPPALPGHYGPLGFYRPPMFPFLGIGAALFFFFAIGGLFRMMTFRHWMHHARMEGYGPWGHHGMHPCADKPAAAASGEHPTSGEPKQ